MTPIERAAWNLVQRLRDIIEEWMELGDKEIQDASDEVQQAIKEFEETPK